MAAKKGSTISSIFGSYRDALNFSQDRYADLYSERSQNAEEFYNDFLNTLVVRYEGFKDPGLRRRIKRDIASFFDREEIQFVSIDGSCNKDPFNDFMVFSSVAYGVRGRVSLLGDPPSLRYERRSMEEDVSLVAYVPVPFAEISDVTNPSKLEDFIVTDQDKVDLSNIHTVIMQLAEIYLAYEMARSTSPDRPRFILMDHSPSSILASTDVGISNIGLIGYKSGTNTLNKGDIDIVFAHPFNEELGLPSTKNFRLYSALIAEVVRNRNKPVNVEDWAKKNSLNTNDVEAQFERNSKAIKALGTYDKRSKIFTPTPGFDYNASWWQSIRIFEDVCHRLFKEKDQEALIYETPDEDNPTKIRQRWMSPDDIKFLIAIGLRALIEECWKNQVMLIGIVKDSSSRYFTRNYYGLMRHIGIYPPIDVKPLPWTDRIVLEDIAYKITEITEPWSTVEFDSCFMTLHLGQPEGLTFPIPVGVKGDVVNQERLFARSLGQFFVRRTPGKTSPLMGHVIFIDRLLHPYWDKDLLDQVSIVDPTPRGLGAIKPFLHKDKDTENIGQEIAMFLLNTLTRNLFPEAIGYPDPLHKADQGAKTVGRRLASIIRDSEISFRSRPISKSFRTIRDERKR